MEFTKRDRMISLIFPVISLLYGVVIVLSGIYHPILERITGIFIIAAALAAAVLAMTLKINTSGCLKAMTIAVVVTVWLHVVTRIQGTFLMDGNVLDVYYEIFFILIDLGSIIIMMFKLPAEADSRQRMIVFFGNPILYNLINSLMSAFSDFLMDIGAITL